MVESKPNHQSLNYSKANPNYWPTAIKYYRLWEEQTHLFDRNTSNYNQANDVAMWPCVWQPTPKTADVTVTKIAGYVRVCILMNQWFFSYFWHSKFLRYGHFVEYVTKQCNEHDWCSWRWLWGGLDFAPMHAIRSVDQCDVNIPSLSPRGSRSKAIANGEPPEGHC